MKGLTWVAIIGIAAFGFWHFRSHTTPSARETEYALRAYLGSPESNRCSGSLTVEQLDDVSVGDYVKEFGGWPVYANHMEVCHSGIMTTTFDSRHDAERKVAAAFVRRSNTGRVEVFQPAAFQQMQQAFQKAVDSIQIK